MQHRGIAMSASADRQYLTLSIFSFKYTTVRIGRHIKKEKNVKKKEKLAIHGSAAVDDLAADI